MGHLASRVPHLTDLDVSWCPFVSEALSGIQRRAREALEQKKGELPLRVLSLSDCKGLSSAGLSSFFRRVALPELQELNLSHVGCVDDVVLGSIAQTPDTQEAKGSAVATLTDLDLSECGLIRDAGLHDLLRACGRTITSLRLTSCGLLTDSALAVVALTCKGLQQLSLSGCMRVSDTGVSAVASKCTQLRLLELEQCEQLTDVGLGAIARSCRELTHLDTSKCPLITDKGVMCVGTYATHMKELLLEDCTVLTNKALMALAIGCRRLEVLSIANCALVRMYRYNVACVCVVC
jgi:hypothetical protein